MADARRREARDIHALGGKAMSLELGGVSHFSLCLSFLSHSVSHKVIYHIKNPSITYLIRTGGREDPHMI